MLSWQSKEGLGIESLVQIELPKPTPENGELLVKVEVAALNYSDLLMLNDTYQVRPSRPFTPGQEVAGTVVGIGEGTGITVGQRIASKVMFGGFAEYVIVRADMAILIPDAMPLSSAVALPVVYTTAVVALTKMVQVQKKEVVLIHAAAGGLGLAAVQLARHLGARVFATAGSKDKCQIAEESGAELAVSYRNPNWRSELMTATEGRGVDIVFDSVGGEVTKESIKCLAWQGRLLIVGFSSGNLPNLPAHLLLLKNASAIGVYWSHERNPKMLADIGRQLVQLFETGIIQPIIHNPYGFSDLPQALQDLQDRTSVGKLVMRFD